MIKINRTIEKLLALEANVAAHKIKSVLHKPKKRFIKKIISEDFQIKDFKPILIQEFKYNYNQDYIQQLLSQRMNLLGSGLKQITLDNSNTYDYEGLDLSNHTLSNQARIETSNSILKKIDWQCDFRTGFRWDVNKKGADNPIAPTYGAEIKIPWEIGRLQFLCDLALDYQVNKNKKSVEYYEFVVDDFIENNPFNYGVQWKTAMDVGIRMVNILNAFAIFRLAGVEFSVDFITKLNKMLFDHLSFINENSEWSGGMRGNHYFANLSSIIILLSFCNNNEIIESSLGSLLIEYQSEIDYQFHDDGSNFEASTSYHLQVMEMIASVIISIKTNFDENYVIPESFYKILDFSEQIINYRLNIGDNDSGLYLPISPVLQKMNDHYCRKNNHQSIIDYFRKDKVKENIFRNFGVFLLDNSNFKLSLRAGGVGQKGKGGHSHNDLLALTLLAEDRPIFVDIGTYNYTSFPDKRNLFRSVNSHNTIIIENFEQNKFYESENFNELFWMLQRCKIGVNTKENQIDAVLYHPKYAMNRKIILEKELKIIDKADSENKTYIQFHLHPSVEVDKKHKRLIFENISINFDFGNFPFEVEEYYYSQVYGIKEIAYKLVVNFKNEIISKFRIV